MKREAYRHPKMLDLAARLEIPLSFAAGLVGSMHEFAADYATQGDIGKHTNGTIARACDWRADPDQFIDALTGAGWLDKCAQRRLVVHDLRDHAPQWLRERLKKTSGADADFFVAMPFGAPKRQRRKNKQVKTEAQGGAAPMAQGGSAEPSGEARPHATNPCPALPSPAQPKEQESERAEAPKVEFVKDVHAEAKDVSAAYHQHVTRAHTSTGIPEVRSLILDGTTKADLLEAVKNAGAWFDLEKTEARFRPAAPKFFSDDRWRRFVAGVPDPVGKCHDPPRGAKQSGPTMDEMRERFKQK